METLYVYNEPRLNDDNFKLSFTLECTNSISWEISLDSGRLVFSDNFEEMYGIRQSDYDYDFGTFLDFHLKPHKDQILESIEKYICGETDSLSIGEITLFNSRCDLHWLHARGKCINNNQKLIYGVSVDITERKKIEQRLAQIEANNWLNTYNEFKQAALSNELVQYLLPAINTTTESSLPQIAAEDDEYTRLVSQLSRREQEVVAALLAGCVSYKDLASALNISTHTVKTHLRHIYQTTGMTNILSLVTFLQRKRSSHP